MTQDVQTVTEQPTRSHSLRQRQLWASTLVLVATLALGAYLRLVGLTSWDGDTYQHPDERFLVFTATNIQVPRSLGDYWQSDCAPNGYVLEARNPEAPPNEQEPTLDSGCNTLNPRNYNWSRFFVYGPLPTTLTRLVAEWRGAPGPNELRDVGRTLSMLFDLGSVLLVFLIGLRLYGRATGLVAALLMALTVLHIQHAHFFTVDTFSAFFTLLALYFAVRVAQGGGVLSYLALGLSIGAGMSVRVTLAVLGLLAIVATVYALLTRPQAHEGRRRRTLLLGYEPDEADEGRRTIRLPLGSLAFGRLGLLVLAGLVTLLTFRALQPDAFVGSSFFDIRPEPRFLQNMQTASDTVSGEVDMPPSHQWAGRTAYWFPWKNMLLWGMGLPLGVAAWAGWAWAGWRLFRWREASHLLPWLWISFWFGWQGAQFVLTQRYQLPIYGPLIVLAAWALVRVAGVEGWHARLHPASQATRLHSFARLAPLLIVVAGTLLWAYAFTRIYTHPHSRIQASRWIYRHVPPGATVTSEEWDDGLPVSVDGYTSNRVQNIQTKPYWEDSYYKFVTTPETGGLGLIDQLALSDYVVLSSNRVYDSVSRLPMRFPATLRYYHSLFNGDLGFELVADIGSYPTLFGIPIYDQGAEEAFSVYDHPRVLIFKKTDAFSRERAEQLLAENVAWDEIYRLRPVKADKAPTALRLKGEQWPSYRAGGTWAALFDPASLANRLPVLFWLLTLELLGLAAFVLTWRLLPSLPDGGFALAKMLALLLVAYGAWVLGSLRVLAFTPLSVWLCAGLLLAAGGLIGWAQRAELWAFVKQRRQALLWGEGLFLLAFALMLSIRYLNPDLWHPARGGEKPMDMAFLNAVLKSAAFPPYDPWFAGGFLNYYYFGFVIVGALVHLTGILPEVAYNLAVPTLFALTALGAWGVAYNFQAAGNRQQATGSRQQATGNRRALASGLLAALFVVVAGNLQQALWFVNGYAAENSSRPEWAFWDATRIVEGTINEFPFFTFLFADLHAHMIVLPMTTLALGLMIVLLRQQATGSRRQGGGFAWLVPTLLLALTIGAIRATNTWEYPTYLGLAVATVVLIGLRQWLRGGVTRPVLAFALPALIILTLGPTILFYPFVRDFGTEYQGVERWHDTLTPLRQWLLINGLWLALLGTAGLALIPRPFRRGAHSFWVAPGVLGLYVGLAAFFDLPALVLSVPLLLGTGVLGIWLLMGEGPRASTQALARPKPAVSTPTLWVVLLAGTALALSVAVEIVRVQGDIGRMNTVFKFGLQSWTLAAIASALALPWLWGQARRWRLPARYTAAGLAAALIGAALVYPITATPARVADRIGPEAPRGLDGLAFAERASMDEGGQRFELGPDLAAIRWLRQNVAGSPVLLEAHTEAYRWGGRFSIYSGLPTVLGWPWHATQQRSLVEIAPIIASRQQVVREIYSSLDATQIRQLLARYGVEYVAVGELEEALYPGARARMEALAGTGALQLVFDGPTRIYQLAPGLVATPQVLQNAPAVRAPLPQHAATLMLDRPVDQLPVVGEHNRNTLAQSSWAATLLWLLALYVLAALGLPLAALAFGRWHDAGWAFARLLGLLLLGYLVWLPVSARLWSYDRWALVFGAVLLLGLNVLALRLQGGRAALWALLRERRRGMLASELVFLAAFAGLLALRLFNPDLWHPIYGGEKPFEFGFLNAILRSPTMPPYDPFYSGGYINYYYYGLFLASLPIKATGIPAAIGFNLAVATLFALLAAAAFALVTQIARRARYGLAALALLALFGNLAAALAPGEQVAWMARGLQPVLDALREGGLRGFGAGLGDWFWGPTRVIPYTINEFPFFTFLFADLHPHAVALPITLLALALAWNVVEGNRQPAQRLVLPATYGLLPLVLGALAVTNSWDFPTYTLICAAVIVGAAHRARRLGVKPFALAIGLPMLGLLLYLPFFQHFRAMVEGLGAVTTPSPAASYLLIYGIFLAALVPLLWLMALRVLRFWGRGAIAASPVLGIVPASRTSLPSLPALARPLRALLLVAPLLLALAAVLWPQERLRLPLVVLLLISGLLLFERRLSKPAWFVALLCAAAWGVSLGVELVYIRDHLDGGDWQRMNSVFKFGLQVWVLLAITAAAALPLLVRAVRRVSPLAQGLLIGTASILALAGLVYPFAGTASRQATRFEGAPAPTLDGLAFMPGAAFCLQTAQPVVPDPACPALDQARIELRHDAEAIAWLNQNVEGTPVVLQSEKEFYRAYAVRVAANTGLPTVVGELHSFEQRPVDEVAQRVADVRTIYDSTEEGQALRLLSQYGVGYVYVGPIERALYNPQGLEKFERLNGSYLTLAYQNQGVRIFEVNGSVRQLVEPSALITLPSPDELIQPSDQPPELLDAPAPLEPQPAPVQAEAPPADLAELEARVASDPRNAGKAYDLGRRYRDLSRYDEAAAVLATAARANPNDVGLHHLWGDILADARRYEEAAEAYRRAAEAQPSAGNYNKLGAALLSWGRLDEAEMALLQALGINLGEAEPHFFLGRLYQQRGQTHLALASYQEYLRLAPPDAQYRGEAEQQVVVLRQ